MTRRLLLKALVVGGVAATLNMVKTAGALAAPKKKPNKAQIKACHSQFDDCMGGCPSVGGSQAYDPNNECHVDCGFKEYECVSASQSSGQESPQDDGGTGIPPKGTRGLDKVDVGGVKDPVGGSGIPPKGTGVRSPVDTGVVKDPVGGGTVTPPKGKTGLGQIDIGGKQLGSPSGGTGTIYKTTPSSPGTTFSFPAGRGRH